MDLKVFFFILVLGFVNSQTTTGNTVAIDLVNCYNNTALPGITIPDQRPPSTLNLFIEYIRKIEDANPTVTPRVLSYLILQTLRQDGVSRTERSLDERFGIPFASSRPERYKLRVLLELLLPSREQNLTYGDLTDFEKCSFHYLISNTIDDLRRDNEAAECIGSARYTSRITRHRRDGEDAIGEGEEDLENTEQINPQDPNLEVLSSSLSSRNTSSCPIELGVIYTQSGTIKAGNVLAGIATGLNQQFIQDNTVDNRYAGTLVGELCEAALFQAQETITVGASGGWNSTVNPKYFFLGNNILLQATDAELRGAIDGLYIALRTSTLTSTFSDIKISQILDMYYSPYEKGVFDTSFKACNRNILYTEMTSTEQMTTQLQNFMPVLNHAAIAGASIVPDAFPTFTSSAITAFNNYFPQMTSSDLACLGTNTIQRVAADLLIFIDTSWQYNTLQLVLSYILDSIDVNKFQTRYTLFGGSSLRNLTTNQTRYLADFHTQYNQSVHSDETTGFNYVAIFEAVENYGYAKLDNSSYAGGDSTIVLLVPRTGLTSDETTFLTQRRQVFDTRLPDVNFLVLGSGSASDYSAIVKNINTDVVILQDTTSEETLKTLGQQVVDGIKEVPRAIINPLCTSQFNGSSSTFFLTDYVEPLGTNYYRIFPNYFYGGDDTRNLRIREQGYGTIDVCLSRDNNRPVNSTENCRSLAQSEFVQEITSYCDGYSVTGCPPIYISVTGANSTINCGGTTCRFPNDIQYIITLENVACYSGSIAQTASALLLLLTYTLSRFS